MNIITTATKNDMSYDYHLKHNIDAVEWKLKAMVTKIKKLIKKVDRNWRQPLNRKLESYHV